MSGAADGRQMCKYGEECYQKNPMHTEKFRHPCDKDSVKEQEKTAGVVEQNGAKRKLSEEEGERVDAGAGGKKGEPNKKAAKVDEKENEKPEDKGGDDEAEEEDEETEDLLPPSPLDPKENIRQKLLVDMPEDFFAFWKFCKERNPSNPADALSPAGLLLVGAFDILSGKLKDSNNRIPSDYLCHYRFYYDVPEFQTVIASKETDFHIGYFRDDPKEEPVFVASNDPAEGCAITPLGENIFGAVYNHLGALIRTATADASKQASLQKLKEAVHVFATMKVQNQDLVLEAKTRAMKAREKAKQSKTFHGAGMVVPFNKETDVGYREIPETTASLKKILKNVNEAESDSQKDKADDVLQELVTNVQFANDEGDPGMGLELGLDAFCAGGDRLHKYVEHLMGVAYELMGRQEYARIIKAHLKRRRAGQVFKIQ